MGMFDTVRCEYPLPDPGHQDLEYQTKDLECLLDTFTITRDGRLIHHARRGWKGPVRDFEWPLHGDVSIYTSLPAPDASHTWIEYVVRFTHGLVEWIRPLEEVRQAGSSPRFAPPIDWGPEPESENEDREEHPFQAFLASLGSRAKPAGNAQGEELDSTSLPAVPQTGGTPPPSEQSAEEALLSNLRRDRSELEKLLAGCGDHWGYEDPVYRFYHQSFKVYSLQRTTRKIVDRLQALAPERPLHSSFEEILRAGTGKTFQSEDNARWTEVTRPIVEAFFHARYFLEMAVRYAHLEIPPQPLPSGYAALLYLFGLR